MITVYQIKLKSGRAPRVQTPVRRGQLGEQRERLEPQGQVPGGEMNCTIYWPSDYRSPLRGQGLISLILVAILSHASRKDAFPRFFNDFY